MNFKIVAAMEGQDVDSQVIGADDTEAAELTQAVADVNQADSENSGLQQSIAVAAEDADELDNIQAVADASLVPQAEGGSSGEGLSPEAAQLAQVSVESISRRLGIFGTTGIPSAEGFGSKNSRAAATRLASESIWSKLKQIWKAIVAAFKNMWTKLKAFVRSIFGGAERLQARAEKMLAKVNETKGAKENDTFKNASIAKAFSVGGKFDAKKVSELVKNHREVASSAIAYINGQASVAKKFKADYLDKKLTGGAKAGVAFQGLVDQVDADYKGFSEVTSAGDLKKMGFDPKSGGDDKKVTVLVGPSLINETAFAIEKTMEKDQGSDNAHDMIGTAKFSKVSISKSSTDTEFDELELGVADTGTLASICRDVIEISKTLIAFKAVEGKTAESEKVFDELFKSLDTILDKKITASKAKTDDEKDEARAAFSVARRFSSAMSNCAQTATSAIPAFSLSAGNLALNYVASSVASYR